MTPEQLKIEISHIFESGANEVRVFELCKKYAASLEQSVWVTDGSVPPVDEDDNQFSLNVLAAYEFDNDVVAYVNLKNKTWYNANSHNQMTEPTAWCHLPSPPKTQQ